MRKFEIAAQLMELTEPEREIMEPFIVSGFDLYSIGSTNFRNGALVGIPINYTYTAPDEIPRTEVTVKGYEQVNWSSKGGELLQEGLILTEKEQIFGIAREMCELRTHNVSFNSFISSGSILLYYFITSTVNQSQKLFSRPRSLRVVLYAISTVFISGVYCFLTDLLKVSTEELIDETLAKQDREYVEAGVGFYDKILKKNMAIRHLTNSNQFTALGNINYYFRSPTIPLTMRKTFFENCLKKLNAANEPIEK